MTKKRQFFQQDNVGGCCHRLVYWMHRLLLFLHSKLRWQLTLRILMCVSVEVAFFVCLFPAFLMYRIGLTRDPK